MKSMRLLLPCWYVSWSCSAASNFPTLRMSANPQSQMSLVIPWLSSPRTSLASRHRIMSWLFLCCSLMHFIRSMMNCFHGLGDFTDCQSFIKIVSFAHALASPLLHTQWYPVNSEIIVCFFPVSSSSLHLPMPVGSWSAESTHELHKPSADVTMPPVM
jgi:hypothetical protein